jgi:hypothetical protein
MPTATFTTLVHENIDRAKARQGDVTMLDGPIDQARDAAQQTVNGLKTNGEQIALATAIAEYEHSRYPQYAGHWNGWGLARAKRRVRTKLGVSVERGDLVLVRSSDIPEHPWTVYSVRNRIDSAMTDRDVQILVAPEA